MYTYEVVVAEKNSTTKTLKRKYDTTMSPVIKDLLRVAHKIATFMCKTHMYLNPFLQTHICLWSCGEKLPQQTLWRASQLSMITTHLTKSCSQSVRCSPLNRHLLKPFLANTYIYKIVEKNSHNKHFEEETQHNNECGHKKTLQELLTEHQIITFISETHTCTKTISCKHIWGCRENSTTSTISTAKKGHKRIAHKVSDHHHLDMLNTHCTKTPFLVNDKISSCMITSVREQENVPKGAKKGRSYQRICSTSVQWCFAQAHDNDQQLSSPSALHKQPSQQLFWSMTLM
jgi:hypothetical protein